MQKKKILGAAVLLMLTAALGLLWMRAGWYLIVSDGDTQQELARYPMEAGDRFGIGFIHSVNKKPLIDVYEISTDHKMYVEETIYYQFGAGVQTEVQGQERMDVGLDGAIVVSNIHKPMDSFTCSVGVVSDRTLLLGNFYPVYDTIKPMIGVFSTQTEQLVEGIRVISLSQLSGRETIVSFSYEYRWW